MTTDSPAPPAADAAAQPGGRSWTSLLIVLTAQFSIVANIGTVTIAIPAIRADLGASDAQVQWVLLTFQLTFAALLITGGRLGDLFGTRRLFLLGFSGFVGATGLAAAAPTVELLIAARVLQGIFGGLAAPQVLAVIQSLYASEVRVKALSAFAAISGSGYMFGQLITGGVMQLDPLGLGWRAALLVYVPIGLAAIAAALVRLPRLRPDEREPLDPGGLVLVAVLAVLVLFPLIQGREAGWPLAYLVVLALALPAGYGFARYERRLARADARKPVLNVELFRASSFRWGVALVSGMSCVALATVVYLTIGLQTGFDLAPLETALVTGPWPLLFIAGSTVAGRAVGRFGRRLIGASALLLACGTLAVIGVLTVGPQPVTLAHLLPFMALIGFSFGLAQPPLVHFALSEVHVRHAGASSGMLQTAQQFGQGVGIALFGIVYFGVADASGASAPGEAALPATLLGALAFAAVLFVAHLFLPRGLGHRR